ncbi:MAG TPA: tripartite tricarboxylate transporter substrate binding protein [Burkholderiales bacterium]|jgi:tripartite-type tricarboxylate transporter receptor subunit TctC|nr:tripartite tricarboxylate transporter substrate binding protein [Burkholderiales bacterium]
MHFIVRGVCAVLAALWLGAAVAQQAYPTKSIRFIVTFPPGGSSDLIARALAPALSERLRQPVLVENRPGAGGNIGMELVAKAAPDGYTMGLGAAGALAANVSLYAKMPYDPVKDFAPVSNVAFVPFFLIAHPSLQANNLQELVALANAKPGQLMLGYGGNGTAMHLSGELFKLMAKVQLVNVPYKGSGPAAVDTVAGQLPLAMVDVASAIAQVKAGRLKALAVTSRTRVSAAPDVPTFAESGLPDYEATGWFGVVMPAGTPAEIVARMNAELVTALKRQEIRERVLAAGAEASPSTPEEFGALIRAEIVKWGEVVRASGAKVD